jgi:hypothetical protein
MIEKVGNVAVDMCIDCIDHNKEKNQPLKGIILNPLMYSIFQNWVAINYTKEMAESMFCFGDVNIYKSIDKNSKIIQEIWEE